MHTYPLLNILKLDNKLSCNNNMNILNCIMPLTGRQLIISRYSASIIQYLLGYVPVVNNICANVAAKIAAPCTNVKTPGPLGIEEVNYYCCCCCCCNV